jgi:hypothetical protein
MKPNPFTFSQFKKAASGTTMKFQRPTSKIWQLVQFCIMIFFLLLGYFVATVAILLLRERVHLKAIGKLDDSEVMLFAIIGGGIPATAVCVSLLNALNRRAEQKRINEGGPK